MKVKDLIQKLQVIEPNSRIDYVSNGLVYPVDKIIDHKDGYAFLAPKREKS